MVRALNAGFFCLLETGKPLVVIGGDIALCDAKFEMGAGETPIAALERLGAAGMTRVWAALDDAHARALEASGAARIVRV